MARGLNGETVYSREDVYVGEVDGAQYGYRKPLRVTVDVRMERLDRRESYETTRHTEGVNADGAPVIVHATVTRPLDYSITTAVWRPDGADWVTGGATVEPLRNLVSYAPGFDAARAAALADTERYHLSGMKAGCNLQTPVHKEGTAAYDLDNTPACPATGYKFGSAWLVEELPDGFADQVAGLMPAEGQREEPSGFAKRMADDGVSTKVTGPFKAPEGWGPEASSWRVKFTRNEQSMTTPFNEGGAHGQPEGPEVMACMLGDIAGVENANGWREWAGELGYDLDDPKQATKAERDHLTIRNQRDDLQRVLGDRYGAYMADTAGPGATAEEEDAGYEAGD